MASFSVDITDIKFAGGRTGSKVVTISNAPAAGIGISNTGYGTHFRVVVQEENVSYSIQTKVTNSSGSSYSSKIRFYNKGDNTDYVDIPIVQYSVKEIVLYANNLISTGTSGVYSLDIDYQSGSTDLYIDVQNDVSGLDIKAFAEVTSGEKWLRVAQASTAITDTGFFHYIISYTDNTDASARTGQIECRGSVVQWKKNKITVNQAADVPAASLSISPTSKKISSAAGTVVVTVTGASTSDISYSIAGSWITFDHISGNDYYFNYEYNDSGTARLGSIKFSATGYLSGVCQLKQTRPMVFSPTSQSVGSSSGSVGIGFKSPDPPSSYNISYDISDSWITFDHISGSNIYFNYTANSGSSSRTGVVTFLVDDFDTESFTLTQAAGSAPGGSLSVSPSSLSFGPDASYADISLTYGGTHFNTAADEVYTWVTVNMSDKGGGQATGTVSVPVNNTTASRKGNIYFTDEEGGSIALPVEQSGIQAVLSANPSSLNIPAEGGTVTTAVTYVGTLSAASLPSWLSETHTDNDANHRTYTVTAASNGPTQERTFNWRLDDDYNNMYVFISQAAKIQSSLVISPTSKSVGEAAGTVEITVRSTNISDISYNISGDWIKYKSKSGSVYTFSYYQNDTMSVRQGSITFSGGGISKTFTLTQEESGISASPSSLTFSAAAGQSKTVVVTYKESLHIVDDTPDWIRVAYDISGSPRNYYFTTELDNTSIYSKQWDVIFYNDKSRLRVPIIQKGKDSVYLTVSPSSSSVSSESGTMYVSVAAGGIKESDINVNVNASWVTRAGNSNFNFYFDYTANTGPIERIAKITFSALGKTATYTLTQRSSQGETMKVTPTELNYTAAGGTKSVTVSGGNGTINVNNGSFPSWLSIKSAGGGVYNLTTTKNTGKARSFTVWFTDNTSTVTMNVYQQAGDTPGPGPTPVVTGSLKAYPKKLRYYSDGGSIAVSFTNRPTAGIGYTITYTDGSGWLSVKNASPDMYVSATANDGIRRRAEIRFYDLNDSTNYVIVPVIQGSVNYYNSIWMDDLYYPKDRDSSGNYFYRVVDRNSGYPYFTGVSSKPLSWSGDIGGIDVPRLVDKYIRSYYEYQRNGEDWANMYLGCSTVDIYNMTENGYPGVVDATFKYWNDWSRFERRYDYTRSLNDPINCKGCNNMIIPFCVYYDDAATFSVVDTEKNGNVNTYTFSAPSTKSSPFAMRRDSYYDSVRVDYKQDNEVIFSYDMTHCGPGAFIYRNRFGGWDSFLLEGNISKTDNYTKQNYRIKGEYNQKVWINSYKYIDEKRTDSIDIDTTYEAYTGWLTDEESERLVFHLLSSPIVYFQNLHKENQVFDTDPKMGMMPIRITASSAEYKKFRNGKRLVNYLITFEKCNIEKVRQ